MNKVFDINDKSIMSIEEVVKGMYECTSEDGYLLAALFNDSGYVRIEGNYCCEMDKEGWDEEYATLTADLESRIRQIEALQEDSAKASALFEDEIYHNYFEALLRPRMGRIAKLRQIGAPECIVQHEVKAFAYYWILNRYCDTL